LQEKLFDDKYSFILKFLYNMATTNNTNLENTQRVFSEEEWLKKPSIYNPPIPNEKL